MANENLQFGNLLHIEYIKVFAYKDLKDWDVHECDCEFCRQRTNECPYCGCEDEPEDKDDQYGIVQCTGCKKLAFNRCYWGKSKVQKIIKDYNESIKCENK